MKFTSNKLSGTEIDISRVTVILGANGSGKSSVLNEIKENVQNICPGKKVVYVEGGRAISLKNSLRLTRQNFENYQDYEKAKNTYEEKRAKSLSDRVYDALMVLERKEMAIKAEHSDAVEKWHHRGNEGSCPVRETPPLERLFGLFHEIFPRLKIEYDATKKIINVRKGDDIYTITNMSDGEKQVFSILADFVELGDDYGLVVVDEPELNLHPELAERIWQTIEAEFPDRIYCYATHSLGFAMRPEVDRVIVLSEVPENITIIENPADFSKIQLSEFLGSIPGILAATRVVVTEGEEKSFDSIFYRWVLNDDQIEVMPAGDCNQVINVCVRDGIWSKIAPNVDLVGVIDGDFNENSSGSPVILPYREAESFLAIPDLALAVDRHLSIEENRISYDEIIDITINNIKEEENIICAMKVATRCGIRIGVSVQRAELARLDHSSALIASLKKSSQEELAKAADAMGDEVIEGIIKETRSEIEKIIEDRNWERALELIDGKKIGNQVARRLGVRNATDLMRSISSGIKNDRIPQASDLASEILNNMPSKVIEPTH